MLVRYTAQEAILTDLQQNAGIGAPPVQFEEHTLESFQAVVNTNLIAPFLCTREAMRIFKAQSPQGGLSYLSQRVFYVLKFLRKAVSSTMVPSLRTPLAR